MYSRLNKSQEMRVKKMDTSVWVTVQAINKTGGRDGNNLAADKLAANWDGWIIAQLVLQADNIFQIWISCMGRRPQYQRGPVRLLLANINFYFMLKYHFGVAILMGEDQFSRSLHSKINWILKTGNGCSIFFKTNNMTCSKQLQLKMDIIIVLILRFFVTCTLQNVHLHWVTVLTV